eukprot:gene1565-biopygen16828
MVPHLPIQVPGQGGVVKMVGMPAQSTPLHNVAVTVAVIPSQLPLYTVGNSVVHRCSPLRTVASTLAVANTVARRQRCQNIPSLFLHIPGRPVANSDGCLAPAKPRSRVLPGWEVRRRFHAGWEVRRRLHTGWEVWRETPYRLGGPAETPYWRRLHAGGDSMPTETPWGTGRWRGCGAGCGLRFGMSDTGVARAWRGHGTGISCSPMPAEIPCRRRLHAGGDSMPGCRRQDARPQRLPAVSPVRRRRRPAPRRLRRRVVPRAAAAATRRPASSRSSRRRWGAGGGTGCGCCSPSRSAPRR